MDTFIMDALQRERALRHEMLTFLFQDEACAKVLGLDGDNDNIRPFDRQRCEQFKKEAEAGSLVAQVIYGALCGGGIGRQPDEDEAKAWLLKAARQGSGAAMTALGILYVHGEKADAEVAQQWFLKAGEANYVRAMTWLVNRFRAGRGTKVSEKDAFAWCRRAAELGLVDAEFVLGTFYLEGYGTRKSKKSALEWLTKAADRGFPKAHLYLGHFYAQGKIVPRDVTKAAEHYQAIAETDPVAGFNLARYYHEGEGVPQSAEKSLHYLKCSAEMGYPPAMVLLGDVFLKGYMGVKPSANKAFKYYREAAEYDRFVPAMRRLVVCYQKGIGIRVSLDKSLSWAQQIIQEGSPSDPLDDISDLF